MTTLTYGPHVPASSGWNWWQWLLVVLGTATGGLLAAAATAFTVFAVGTTCDTDATVNTLRAGQLWLLLVLAASATPGALLLVRSRRPRWALVLLPVAPPLYALITMTSVGDWNGVSFCF